MPLFELLVFALHQSKRGEEMEGGGGVSHQYRRGLWTDEEDKILMEYVEVHGKGQWNRIAKKTGLKRCGKSCRLRWVNYLSPNVKRGNFTEEEEDLIIRLHKLLGNRWSLIAGRVPGRTDNQVKNYWNTHLSKRNGSTKRPRTESYTPNPDTKSPARSKDSETMTAGAFVSLDPLRNNTGSTTENPEQETTAAAALTTVNNVLLDASFSLQNADAFLADGQPQHYASSSQTWRDQMEQQMQMSSYQSLVQFSDEFLQFDFGWSSLFSD
uniref:Uncharacterized protein n=2 Tax=Kalanchoe fedtschenkoi TaxID=63787 RepID=A0A7N0U9H1_KALFE